MYEENISRKRLSICPKNYNCKKWSAPITYYSNHDASFKLIISGETELNPGRSSSNRIGNQRDANVTALKCNICLRKNSKRLMCEHWKLLVHVNDANVKLKPGNLKIARLWSCHSCTLRELPLYYQDVLPMNKKGAS